jgi:hypothetical protein
MMKWISSIVSACIIIFSVWLFIDNRYMHCDAGQDMEIKLAGALDKSMSKQSELFTGQIRVSDQRQLDQLRVSRSLLENEIRRNPNDRLLQRDLEIINGQIRVLEDRLRQ